MDRLDSNDERLDIDVDREDSSLLFPVVFPSPICLESSSPSPSPEPPSSSTQQPNLPACLPQPNLPWPSLPRAFLAVG